MTYRRLLWWNKLAVTERGDATGFLTAPPLEAQQSRVDASLPEKLTRMVLRARTHDQSAVGRGP